MSGSARALGRLISSGPASGAAFEHRKARLSAPPRRHQLARATGSGRGPLHRVHTTDEQEQPDEVAGLSAICHLAPSWEKSAQLRPADGRPLSTTAVRGRLDKRPGRHIHP